MTTVGMQFFLNTRGMVCNLAAEPFGPPVGALSRMPKHGEKLELLWSGMGVNNPVVQLRRGLDIIAYFRCNGVSLIAGDTIAVDFTMRTDEELDIV